MVLFFGDHQPSNAVTKYVQGADTQNEQRYEVPYVIWANFDIEENTNADTSANYLSAEVLKLAGIETTAYQNYLLELKETYPVISAMRVQKADGTDTNARKEADGLNEYQMLQYYQLFDQ